eukprot:scaffold4510_cov183-Amphora_coffeaeformis.AAC.94
MPCGGDDEDPKYAAKTVARIVWKACPADVKRKRSTVVAAARVGVFEEDEYIDEEDPLADELWEQTQHVQSAEFWMAVWDTSETTTSTNSNSTSIWKTSARAPRYRPCWDWRKLPKKLQRQKTLAAQWMVYHSAEFLQNYDVGTLAFSELSEEFQDQYLIIDKSVEHILRRHSGLAEQFLPAVLGSSHPVASRILLRYLSPRLDLLDHRDQVLEACRVNGYLIRDLPLALQLDETIVRTALQARPEALTVLSSAAQITYPRFVAEAMTAVAAKIRERDGKADGTYTKMDPQELEDGEAWARRNNDVDLQIRFMGPRFDYFDLYEAVDQDLWQNREVALAWVRAGGSFLHDDFADDLDDDPEFALALAEFSPSDFMFVSERLLNDPGFMRKAIQLDGKLLRDAGDDVPFDLTLLAFSSEPDLVKHYDWTDINGSDFKFLTDFASKVRRRLLGYDSFATFLHGFAIRETSKTSSPVALLQCGQETSCIFKRMVGDFIGIPVGEDLRVLRKCSEHLQNWGF